MGIFVYDGKEWRPKPLESMFSDDDWLWIRQALVADVLRRKANHRLGGTTDHSGRSAELAQAISDWLDIVRPLLRP